MSHLHQHLGFDPGPSSSNYHPHTFAQYPRLESRLELCESVDDYLDQCIKHRLQCVQAGWKCEDGIYTMIAVNGLDEAHHHLKMSLMAKENLTFEQFEKALKRHSRMNRANETGLKARAVTTVKDSGGKDDSWKHL